MSSLSWKDSIRSIDERRHEDLVGSAFEAKALIRSSSSAALKLAAAGSWATSLRWLGKSTAAEEILAISISHPAAEGTLRAELLRRRAAVEILSGKEERAFDSARAALLESSIESSDEITAECLGTIGYIFHRVGQLKKSTDAYEKALQLSTSKSSDYLWNLAILQNFQNLGTFSRRHYEKALELEDKGKWYYASWIAAERKAMEGKHEGARAEFAKLRDFLGEKKILEDASLAGVLACIEAAKCRGAMGAWQEAVHLAPFCLQIENEKVSELVQAGLFRTQEILEIAGAAEALLRTELGRPQPSFESQPLTSGCP